MMHYICMKEIAVLAIQCAIKTTHDLVCEYYHGIIKVRSHLSLFSDFSQTKSSDFNSIPRDREFCVMGKYNFNTFYKLWAQLYCWWDLDLHPEWCVLCHLLYEFNRNSLVSNGRLHVFLLHCIYFLFAILQIFYSFTEENSFLNAPYVLLLALGNLATPLSSQKYVK